MSGATSQTGEIVDVVEEVGRGNWPKPNKNGKVLIPLPADMDSKRVKAEKTGRGQMKDTLDRLWWDARFAERKKGSPAYAAFKATGGMLLDNVGGKAYLVATESKLVAMRDAYRTASGTVSATLGSAKGSGGLGKGTSIMGPRDGSQRVSSTLAPFRPKADTDYIANVIGGAKQRTRKHETLVNSFASWLRQESGGRLDPKCNAVIDLGLDDPAVIVEAKTIASWPKAIREAVGQLYEYRHFQIVDPKSRLVFLADKPVPAYWIEYLEGDRKIVVAWREPKGFAMTDPASRAFGLRVLKTQSLPSRD